MVKLYRRSESDEGLGRVITLMKGFVAGVERAQASLLPETLEDWVDESNAVRLIDAFVDAQCPHRFNKAES